MKLKDKTIWITGASSGIGEALSKECSEQGASLILSARNKSKLEELKSTLAGGADHQILPLDLSSEPSLIDAVKSINTKPIDILINNGGISQRGLAIETDLEVHRKVMEVNYFGTIRLTQLALPFIRNTKGMIVNIASVAGKVGGQSMAGYAASKHALIGYMDSLRAEETCHGINVLNVCPGFVKTHISLNSLTENGKPFGKMAASIATGITPKECAAAIVEGIVKQKKEITVGKGISRWAPLIKRISPNLLHYVAAKTNVR